MTFVVLTSYLLFSMIILILVDQFSILYFNPRSFMHLFNEHRRHFDEVWERFAENHGGHAIKEHDLYNFFVCLKMPLGFNSTGHKLDKLGIYKKKNFSPDIFHANLRFNPSFILSKLGNMRLPLYKGLLVHYHFVFYAALKNAFNLREGQLKGETKSLVRAAKQELLAELEGKRINARPRASKQYTSVMIKQMFLRVVFEGWARKATKK